MQSQDEPVHVPQPALHTMYMVTPGTCLNAILPMASGFSPYSIVSVARFDCAKPCCPTAAQPAVMMAQSPGIFVTSLYPF